MRGVAGEHDEARAHRGRLVDVVGDYRERVIVGLPDDERGPVGHGRVVEHDVVEELLVAVGVRLTVDQPDIAFRGQRAHAAQNGKERSFHFNSPFLVKYLA